MIEDGSSHDDPLLLPLLHAVGEEEIHRRLNEIIIVHAEPLARKIIKRKLSSGSGRAELAMQKEAEDLLHEVLQSLLERLRRLKADPINEAIRDFQAYVAKTSYNKWNELLRRLAPQRHRLKARLKTLLDNTPTLARWRVEDGGFAAGLTAWREEQSCVSSASLAEFRESSGAQLLRSLPGLQTKGWQYVEPLTTLFRWTKEPVDLDDLTNLLADLTGVHDRPPIMIEDARALASTPSGPRSSPANEAEQRDMLKWTWEEIKQLPPRQRAALLLHTEEDGADIAALLAVASFGEIAAALNLTPEELSLIWEDIPLDDQRIAKLCGATRQQVADSRKNARARIKRRLRNMTAAKTQSDRKGHIEERSASLKARGKRKESGEFQSGRRWRIEDV